MKSADLRINSKNSLGKIRREFVRIDNSSLVKQYCLQSDTSLPLVIEAGQAGMQLDLWCAANRDLIESSLRKHAGVLFRRFQVRDADEFERVIRSASRAEMLDYSDGSSPRLRIKDNIFTSTEYPAGHEIQLHSELSYSNTWPLKLFFYCEQPATDGGETPLADTRVVLSLIPDSIRELFLAKGVMYVRNFRKGIGLSWQECFRCSDPSTVEGLCKEQEIEWEWKATDHLRTRQKRTAISHHPETGEAVWFNHAAFFHLSSLRSDIRKKLIDDFGAEDCPYNTYFGDESPISPEAIAEIQRAYRKALTQFPWETGDVLLLDNMLAAHGRRPFIGRRKVLVGMSEAARRSDKGAGNGNRGD